MRCGITWSSPLLLYPLVSNGQFNRIKGKACVNPYNPPFEELIKSLYCHPTWSAGVPPIKFLAPLLPRYNNLLSINLFLISSKMNKEPCLRELDVMRCEIKTDRTSNRLHNMVQHSLSIEDIKAIIEKCSHGQQPWDTMSHSKCPYTQTKKNLGHRFQILQTSIAGQEEYMQLCLGTEFERSDCSRKRLMTTALPWKNPEMGFC
uniref:Uncharacterized protein n=1 Tax=Solanum lycopersicum TaxID=4081 RepID=A0A3Q7J5I4_SOLLC